jgi:hypothetical protein
MSVTAPLFDAQQAINTKLGLLHLWSATLHFSVTNFSVPVDIFQYTDPKYKVAAGQTHPIQFDPLIYPPTIIGLDKLKIDLSLAALNEGTCLNQSCTPYTLTCFRCSLYQNHSKWDVTVESTLLVDEDGTDLLPDDKAPIACDKYGVKSGIRQHAFHHDSMFKRSLGKDQVCGSTTSLPKDLRYRCDVKFTLKFYQMTFIFIVDMETVPISFTTCLILLTWLYSNVIQLLLFRSLYMTVVTPVSVPVL